MPKGADGEAPRIAVATQEGVFVNQHLGEAETLAIFAPTPGGYRMEGERETAPRGLGDARWETLAASLADIDVLLVSGVGPKPLEILTSKGIKVVELTGFIDEHLESFHKGQWPVVTRSRADFSCGSECSGTGTGCAS